ncbi:MAG: hypothetical protein H7321_05985, partial [Bacteroidia bacterium]|nr:hypothetical protein [Bacteroidia bacterium]
MKKLVTKLKSTGLRLALAVFSTVGLSAVTAVGQPSLPWCNSNHYYHTAYYSPSAYMNAIEQVKVETTAGSLIYNKNPDGPNFTQGVCQSDWKLVNTPSKSFTLIAGSSYVVSVSGSSKNGYTSMVIGLWIDLNKDYTFSSSEYLTTSWTASFTNGGTPGSLSAKTIKIPCGITAGATRMRIVTDYQYGSMNSSYGCNGVCNGSNPNYGETEDFSIDLALPTTITADFVAPATAFIKTNVKFLNKDKTNIFNDWDADVNGYNYSPSTGGAASPIDPDYQFTWNTTGNKCVKLRATNCLGKDSIVKCFNVVAPTQIPVADFIASATKIEQYQTAQLFDLSTQGPYQWTWSVYDSSNLLDIKDLASGYVYPINGTTTASQNPIFSFDAAGCYTVLLTTKNDVGLSKRVMKKCYITVVEPTQYNLCYGPNKSESATGTVYDYGGPNLPYTNINADPGCARLTITPCNAKKINLTFTKIKLGAGHFVSVYDAAFKDKSKLLYTITNADKPKLPFTITALSGSMYIDMEGSSGTVDSGFAAFYKSELGTGTPPIANFAAATTPGYNRVPLRFTNLSNNLAGVPKYTWTIDGSPVSAGEVIAMPDGRDDMLHTFFTDGQYDVCLDIVSCTGTGRICQLINIVTPNTPTQLDFTASNVRPSTGDLVRMTTVSDKADKFLWSIFPLTYTLQAGSTLKSKNPVLKFNNAGKYTFTLRAWNSNDSANTVTVKIKDKYVVVLDYCKPLSQLLSADVAINRVIITDKNNN